MTDTGPTEYTKQHWKEAERAHDGQLKAIEIHTKQIEAFSVLGIRTLALTAAGGIAATLGFYSANFARLSTVPEALERLNAILVMLFISMLITLLTILLAYLSQVMFTHAIDQREMTYEHPYVRETTKSKRSALLGDICRYGSIGTSLTSVAFLVVAGINFAGLVR